MTARPFPSRLHNGLTPAECAECQRELALDRFGLAAAVVDERRTERESAHVAATDDAPLERHCPDGYAAPCGWCANDRERVRELNRRPRERGR